MAERYAAIGAFLAKHAREDASRHAAHRRQGRGVLGRRRLCRPLSARGPEARHRAGVAPHRLPRRADRALRAYRSPRWRPTRSAPTRGSAPTPTSSTCSTSPPLPCPGRCARTAAPPASPSSAPRTRCGAGKPRACVPCHCRDHHRRHGAAPAAARAVAGDRAGRHARACRRRRASLRPGAQPRAARARRLLPARGRDRAVLPALCLARRPAGASGPGARRRRHRACHRRRGVGAAGRGLRALRRGHPAAARASAR